MIITDDFVMLLFPKTGTSFTRVAFDHLYKKHKRQHELVSSENFLNPPLEEKWRYSETQHGFYAQIPEYARGRPVYAILRNIYGLLISEYGYVRWQVDWLEYDQSARKFPDFPLFGFSGFIDYSAYVVKHRLRHIHHNPAPPARLGMQSYRFLLMFCRDPWDVLATINDESIESGEWLGHICPVKFLQQHRLRDDLQALLGQFGFPADSTEVINHLPARLNNRTRKPGAQPGAWEIGMPDVRKYMAEKEKAAAARKAGEAIPAKTEVPRETIIPDAALIERIEQDEKILFRFMRGDSARFHACGAWDAKALTTWPES